MDGPATYAAPAADGFLNESVLWNFTDVSDAANATNVTSPAVLVQPMGKNLGVLVKVVYLIGILANAAAIVTLRTGERRVRNRKHLLLLTSLAANDLVALMGMLGAMLVGDHVPGVRETRVFCASRVVLRIFGIGSVCIAVTMALERYLALTRPFLYQKQVTYYVIRTALLVSWLWAALLTCAPILGLGLYYHEGASAGTGASTGPGTSAGAGGGLCLRYRNATSTTDYIYAVFYVIFGTALCLVLVYCNLAVIRALYAITTPRAGGGAPVVRRVSKSSCRSRQQRSLGRGSGAGLPALHHNAATAEEVAFSRLMAMLSVLFMICWLPQMTTSALYLALGRAHWPRLGALANLSDVLMLLNYVLDPVLYVLMRLRARPLAALRHSIATCFKRGHKRSTESMSMKTSCCAQDTTVVVSDSSAGAGAELRPLHAPPRGVPGTDPDPACTASLIHLHD